MTTCIGCGCTDEEACDGGCSWIAVSEGERAGLCSACGLGSIGAVDIDEAAWACEQAEQEWAQERADQYAIDQDQRSPLLLPGDPEYYATLRGERG